MMSEEGNNERRFKGANVEIVEMTPIDDGSVPGDFAQGYDEGYKDGYMDGIRGFKNAKSEPRAGGEGRADIVVGGVFAFAFVLLLSAVGGAIGGYLVTLFGG